MSKLEFGQAAVPSGVFTNGGLSSSTSSFIAERRAYAKFSYNGTSICGKGNTPTSIESGIDGSYESILSGPRLVPPPSLTSVDFSNDSANDIYDGYLWKATVNFTCYSPEQFNGFDTKFFQHFNKVSLTLGWLTGDNTNPITIYGTIIDYQFSINEKLHYDCSVTFAGSALESSAAFDLNLTIPNTTVTYSTGSSGLARKPQSIVGYLKALAIETHKGWQTPTAGSAVGSDNYIRAKFTLNATSWLFWNQEKEVHYVSLNNLIQTINLNLPKQDDGFGGIELNIATAQKVTDRIKSANPISVLNLGSGGKSATYVDPGANFRFGVPPNHYYISFDTLEKIEKELVEDKSDNPHATKNTLIQFIKRVLDEINGCLGESIKLEMIPYGQSGQSTNHGYEIVDRKTIIKKIDATPANPLDVNSTIRSISVQSTLDSELASIALSAAHSGKSQGVVKGVFGCEPKLPDVVEDKNELATAYAMFVKLDESTLGDCVQILKKICNVQLPQQVGYRYGVTVTITVDGYPDYLFGKVFTVAGLPAMLRKSNVYFIVTKQSHKYSNGDWTMDLEGQMMFDIGKNAEPPILGFDPIKGAAIKAVVESNEEESTRGLFGYG